MYTYNTSGVCSRQIHFDIIDGKLHNVHFDGGCPGNLAAICTLIEGKDAKEIATLLAGNKCGNRPTSCADQLSKAIFENLQN